MFMTITLVQTCAVRKCYFPVQADIATSTATRSKLSNYFNKNDSNRNSTKIKCKLCELEVDHKGGSTSAASRHLKRRHEIEIGTSSNKKTKNDDDHDCDNHPDGDCSGNNCGASSQPKLKTFLLAKKQFDSKSFKAKQLTYHVTKSIFLDLRPLSIVDDEGFRGLLSCAESRYVIPTRATFRTNIIPRLYRNCKTILKRSIAGYKQTCGSSSAIFSITTDGWTSSNSNTSYVTYTLHINGESQIESYVLSTVELSKKHTAVNLRAHLLQTLQNFEILPPSSLTGSAKAACNKDEIPCDVEDEG